MQLHLEASVGEYIAWLDHHDDTAIVGAETPYFNPLLHWLNYENEDGPFSLNERGNLQCGALRVLAPGWILAIISDYMIQEGWLPTRGLRTPVTMFAERRRLQRLGLR